MSRGGADPDEPDELDDGIETIASAVTSRARGSVLRATVVEGPDAGHVFLLDPTAPSRILLGTSPACLVRLSDPRVSRRHLAFEPATLGWRVVDLGSKNGTILDGVTVRDAVLGGHEILRCGNTGIRFETERTPPAALHPSSGFGKLVGASAAMRRLYPLCERLAASSIPVIVEGETGTGKEALAESLHAARNRSGPFVVLDCTVVSPATNEAELFGVEGAAGAPPRPGYFEQANGGTLFIDEIAELDPRVQPKLLRALERGEIRRLGAANVTQVDVRVIAATRRDLDKEIAAGRFRDDLFHRLAVARIELPPLRDRQGDVRILARHFAKELGSPSTITPEMLARFEGDPWPGNVRELRNAVVRAIAVGQLVDVEETAATTDDVPARRGDEPSWADEIVASGLPLPVARRQLVEEFERRYVQRILAEHEGNVSRAALASGIALRYFQLVKARAVSGK